MKPINSLTEKDIVNIKVITFDVDGVTVPRGTKIKYKNDVLELYIKHSPKTLLNGLRKLSRYFHINISSGRSLLYLMEMYKDLLDVGNLSFTVENGHYTYFNMTGEIVQHRKVNIFERQLLKKIRFNNEKRVEIEPKEMILTMHTPVKLMGLNNYDLPFFYNGEAYDIGKGSKAEGIEYFQKFHGEVLAIGDNYNDKEMLKQANISVTADKDRVQGHYFINDNINLPGYLLIKKLLWLKRRIQ